MIMLGNKLLDQYVENMEAYQRLRSDDTTTLTTKQQNMKDNELEKFWGLLLLKQANQSRYGYLLRDWRQAFSNKQHNLYPKDLVATFEVMKTATVQKQPKHAKG